MQCSLVPASKYYHVPVKGAGWPEHATTRNIADCMWVEDLESVLEMEPVGKPLSITDAFLFWSKDILNMGVLFGTFLKQHGFYVIYTESEIQYLGPQH